jgi:hypothetical protein
MRRFLNNLVRDFWTTKPARPARRRANLQLEGLEDRLVPTSVTLQGSTVLINNIAQGHTITLESTGFNNGFRGLEVLDNGVPANNPNLFNISSIDADNITVSGNDQVFIDDSNGMPFAQNSTITTQGSGANILTLTGSRGISGNETFVAGTSADDHGEILIDNLKFVLESAVTSVNDYFAIVGELDVQTSGTNVVQTGSNGFTQTLSGLGSFGGDTLNFSQKNIVILEEYAFSAAVTLDATQAAAVNPAGADAVQPTFLVNLHNGDDRAIIDATPATVETGVQTIVAPVANSASVQVEGNAGQVSILANSTTSVSIGDTTNSMNGIQANVSVTGAAVLFLDNDASSATENVTISQSAVKGSGLFGNNAVTVFYSNVADLDIAPGSGIDNYTIQASQVGDAFTSHIDIGTDARSFDIDVVVDSGSHLQLTLNDQEGNGSMVISPDGGTVSSSGTPNGVADVSYDGALGSQITYVGMDDVFG